MPSLVEDSVCCLYPASGVHYLQEGMKMKSGSKPHAKMSLNFSSPKAKVFEPNVTSVSKIHKEFSSVTESQSRGKSQPSKVEAPLADAGLVTGPHFTYKESSAVKRHLMVPKLSSAGPGESY